MSSGGWIFMSASIGFVCWLAAYCFYKVLSKPQAADHLQAPTTIETGDEGT